MLTAKWNDDPKCPLCDDASDWIAAVQNRDFFHCSCCDLIFVPPHQHLSEQAERARYLTHENTITNKGYVAMLTRPIDLLGEHCPDAKRVLDYGSGPTPILVQLLRRSGYDAVGYDPLFAPDADLTGLFDAVISVETFEHFARPRDELERIMGLLRPGGGLAVMTRFHEGPDSIEDWWYARDASHVSFYSVSTLNWIAEEHDLTLVFNDNERLALFQALNS